MSDTQEREGLSLAPEAEPQVERLIALPAFAVTLRPQVIDRHPNGRPKKYSMGHADEIWLKVLEVNHSSERHMPAEWFKIIDGYRHQPAHPADPKYKREGR